ncbi:MAG TPA: pyridoxamine 5'-phosphate oxidase family protein [Verrucomicrobiae bacterium]|nr:pyridoxamine 5'-phosphate oxidase family protein [Verrucomicrobiae bacterium]
MDNSHEKIHGLLKKFDTAMLVTHGRDYIEHARPMGIAGVEDNCDLWFFTEAASEKAREIEHDSKVLLVFQKDHAAYISITGLAQLTTDRLKAAELWKDSFKTYFPGGANDPNLMLIKVIVLEAEYWDNTGFKGIKYLFEAASARSHGTRPHIDEPEQHGKVNLK